MSRTTSQPVQILWATADGSPEHRVCIQDTAREFKMEVQFCSHDKLSELTAARHWRLLGLELGSDRDADLTRIGALNERFPQLPIFVASPDQSIETMRAVLTAGAAEFLSLPINPAELGKVLLRFTQRTDASDGSDDVNGQVISIYGARGGLGATTLTVALAVKIASLTESKVAIVDLDLQRGDISTFLNLTAHQSLASMASSRSDVDQAFLEGIMTRHASNVFVLSAPGDLVDAELITREHVVTTIGLLRSQFGYSLIDTARMLTDATMAAFEKSDRILLITDLSVPGVRAGQRTLDLLTRVSIDSERVDVLLTVPGKSDVTVNDATRAMGKPPFAIIPRDELSATAAMNAGTPLNGTPNSALSQSIMDLASKLTGIEQKQQGGQLLRRFLGLGRTL